MWNTLPGSENVSVGKKRNKIFPSWHSHASDKKLKLSYGNKFKEEKYDK